ncbi:MAG: cytochrome c3 family protein [Anaerolineae bacterium]|nr:cytochrome c3 family protein [Anaerolineae bacterium]
MNQIFHPSMNTIARASILGMAMIAAGLAIGWYFWVKSPYLTQVNIAREQPVPFSHQHHVKDLGIDCRYCHTSVEQAAFAGIPPTQTCMTCHSQIHTEAAMLEPVRASYRTGHPLRWTRVHDLSGFVYFDHSIHVNKGIGCETCHGRVDEMPLTWKTETMLMEWCLQCHRAPEKYIRPREEVLTMDYIPKNHDQLALGTQLITEYDIETGRLDDCSICHR